MNSTAPFTPRPFSTPSPFQNAVFAASRPANITAIARIRRPRQPRVSRHDGQEEGRQDEQVGEPEEPPDPDRRDRRTRSPPGHRHDRQGQHESVAAAAPSATTQARRRERGEGDPSVGKLVIIGPRHEELAERAEGNPPGEVADPVVLADPPRLRRQDVQPRQVGEGRDDAHDRGPHGNRPRPPRLAEAHQVERIAPRKTNCAAAVNRA